MGLFTVFLFCFPCSQYNRDFHERAVHPQLAQASGKRKAAQELDSPPKRSRDSETHPGPSQHPTPPNSDNEDAPRPNDQPPSPDHEPGTPEHGILPEEAYTVRRIGERVFANTAREVTFEVSVKQLWLGKSLDDMHADIVKVIGSALQQINAHGTDRVRVVLYHGALDPIVVPLRPCDEMTPEAVLAEVEKVCQSNRGINVDASFQIRIGVIHLPRGRGRPGATSIGPAGSMHNLRGASRIKKNDYLCLSRAVGVCWLHRIWVEKLAFDEWCTSQGIQWPYRGGDERFEFMFEHGKCSESIYKNVLNGRQIQEDLAKWLCKKIDTPTNVPGSLADIHKYEELLGVKAFLTTNLSGNKVVTTRRENTDVRPSMFLHLEQENPADDGHYSALFKMNILFSRKNYCEYCLQAYDKLHEHKCPFRCYECKRPNCTGWSAARSCRSCNFTFKNAECYATHLEQPRIKRGKQRGQICGRSLCETTYRCQQCHKTMQRRLRDAQDHICGEWKCPNCKVWVNDTHHCFMRSLDKRTQTVGIKKWLIWDFETTQDQNAECVQGYIPVRAPGCEKCTETCACSRCRVCKNCKKSWCGRKEHIPNFCISLKTCDKCKDDPITELDPNTGRPTWRRNRCTTCGDRCVHCMKSDLPCQGCGYRERVFAGPNTSEEFAKYLIDKRHKDFKALAHNMGNFDGYFLLDEIVKRSMKPSTVFNGGKLMKIHVGQGYNITILDTLLFMPLPLAKLAQTFGVPELKKGN